MFQDPKDFAKKKAQALRPSPALNPMDPDRLERSLRNILARLKAAEEAENGPGAFEDALLRGEILMRSRIRSLTPVETAFLEAPVPRLRH